MLLLSVDVLPERWLDAEFTHALNDAAEIVAEHFAEQFIHLGHVRLAAGVAPNFAFIMEKVDSAIERAW